MKKKQAVKRPNGGVFKTIVRSVVKEELIPIKGELRKVEEKMESRFFNLESRFEKLEEKVEVYFRKFRDEIFTKLDAMMGELKTIREEQAAQTMLHEEMDERVENLESIHPNGQHPK